MLNETGSAKPITWDLQRTFNWEFILPDIEGGIGSAISSYVQEVKFEDYNFADIVNIRHGAFKSHTAGFLEINEVSISILSPTDQSVLNYFEAWKNLIVTPLGVYGYKSSYAKTAWLILYDKKYDKL